MGHSEYDVAYDDSKGAKRGDPMRRKLIIDGNAVYEIDDDCICRKEARQMSVIETWGSGQIMTDASGRTVGQRTSEKTEKDGESEQRKNIRVCQYE